MSCSIERTSAGYGPQARASDNFAMSDHLQWEPSFAVGDELIDEQHRALLALCNDMADACPVPGPEGDDPAQCAAFDEAFARLGALVREHISAEMALLVRRGHPDAEVLLDELAEFDELSGQIATPEFFDRVELHRFAAVWCLGHVTESSGQLNDAAPN